MSAIYHTEPATQGKVLVKTSCGDIDVELWPKEAPLACRNFVQLALEGYFDNTIVHRVIKDSLVQMGDPTGTGLGGKSIWDRPFKDEIHGRIKFNHRGQLAMANENKPNSNQSQFFVTLGPCEWLDRKHTIFGKVTGNTIFNVIRMGEVDVGENDRPIDTIKVFSLEVLWNPFEDIIPRDLSLNKSKQNQDKPVNKADEIKKNRKAVKDLKLLSFGEEEDENNNEEVFKGRIHSSHDSKFKDKKLSSKVPTSLKQELEQAQNQSITDSLNNNNSKLRNKINQQANYDYDDSHNFDRVMKNNMLKKKVENEIKNNNNPPDDEEEDDVHNSKGLLERIISNQNKEEISAKSIEYNKLREDLLRSRRAINVITGSDAEKMRAEAAFKDLATPLEQMRQKYKKRKNEYGDRSEETLEKLKMFTDSLRKEKTKVNSTKEVTKENKNASESYHGQVLQDNSDEEVDLQQWHLGKLKFRKHIDDSYRSLSAVADGADGRNAKDYEVIDNRVSMKSKVSQTDLQQAGYSIHYLFLKEVTYKLGNPIFKI
eukprot:gene7310-9958_t